MVLYRNWSGDCVDLEILNFSPHFTFITFFIKYVHGLMADMNILFKKKKSICEYLLHYILGGRGCLQLEI